MELRGTTWQITLNDPYSAVMQAVATINIYLIIKEKGHTGYLHCSKTYT